MRAQVSFFNVSDGTAIGNLDQLDLAYIPTAGQKITFAGHANNDGWVYRVSHVEHVICIGEEPVQIVDIYLSKDTPVR